MNSVFSHSVQQVNPNIIKIDCVSQLLKIKLDARDYDQYRELTEELKSTQEAKLIISVIQ